MFSENFTSVGDEPSVRDKLRAATMSWHKRVDQHMSSVLLDPVVGYAEYLATIATVMLPLERALEQANVQSLLPDWPDRARSSALRSDLAQLLIPVPPSQELNLPNDEPYLFGVLYVTEGSRLGARVLSGQLRTQLNAQQHGATSFLNHGQERSLWQTFLRRLEASRATRRHIDLAITGACRTFDMFAQPRLAR